MNTRFGRCPRSVRVWLALVALAVLLPSGAPAEAATATDSLVASTQVFATCVMNVSTQLSFPAYDINAGGPLAAGGTFDVTCSQGSPIYITLSQGSHPAPGSTDTNPLRQLSAGGTDRINYGLFLDASYTIPWGNTFATGATLSGLGGNDSVALFAQIPSGQHVKSGTYTDSVTASVTY